MKTSNKILFSVFGIIISVIVLLAIIARSYFLHAIMMPGHVIIQTPTITNGKNSSHILMSPIVKPFNEVAIGGAWDIKIHHGKHYSLKLKASPAIKPYINVTNVNGELKLYLADVPRGVFRDYRLRAVITTPKLNKIKTGGAAKILFNGFKSKNFTIDSAGATNVYGKNNYIENLRLKSAGASHFNLMRSKVKNAHISFAGASAVSLNMAGGTLTGKVVGFSSIKYAGTVKAQEVKTVGFASLKLVE